MIVNCSSRAFALLADGHTCELNGSANPEIKGPGAVSELIVCPRTGKRIIITQDGRIYVDLFASDSLEDITDTVCSTLGKGMDDIIKVCIDDRTIVAHTENCIVIIKILTSEPAYDPYRPTVRDPNLKHCITGFEPAVYPLTSLINMVSIGYDHGFVRTDDGCLYSFGCNTYCERGVPRSDDNEGLQRVDIDYANRIHEIICGDYHTLLLMDDKTVRACGSEYGNGKHWRSTFRSAFVTTRPYEPFTHVSFPEGIQITQIVAYDTLALYITDTGLCYLIDSHDYRDVHNGHNLRPVQLKALEGYVVSNVFILGNHIAVQYGSKRIADQSASCTGKQTADQSASCTGKSKICLLCMTMIYEWADIGLIGRMGIGNLRIDTTHADDAELLIHLPFLDDKAIISAVQVSNHAYFTADDGSVYHSIIDPDTREPLIESVPFFDCYPIATHNRTQKIRSAASMIGQDA